MLTGVVDERQQIHREHRERSTGLSEEQLIDELGEEIEEAMAARPKVVAAGLGIPSTIDQRRGLAISSVNLPIADVPIRDRVAERVGLPVFIENDANCAAFAEYLYGAGRGSENLVVLTIGTGVGGGLIIGGEIYRGSIGAGAELGHMVIDENGPRCQGNCPNHGCVEALASGTAIAKAGKEAAERNPDSALGKALADGPIVGRTVTELALAGDGPAREVVAQAGRHIGVALSSLANIFDPDVFVIGGGVSAVGDLLLDPARQELRTRALPPMNKAPVQLAQLGPEAGMIG